VPGASGFAELPLRPPPEEERQIALLRLPFALPPLLLFLNGLGPVAYPGLSGTAAAAYALYAILSALVAMRTAGPPKRRRPVAGTIPPRISLAIDLVFATLLLYAIGSPALPPVLLSLYAVFAAALRWGPAGAAATAILGAGMGGLALWNTPAAGHIGFICLFLFSAALLGTRSCGIFVGRGRRALDAERDRIARDLHDDFIQNLVAAGLRVELCRRLLEDSRGAELSPLAAELEALQELLNTSLEQSRRYLATMRPGTPTGSGLSACLDQCVRELFRGQPVETQVAVSPAAAHLSPEVETAAFYIAREALFNARKHAAPQQVVVSLECRHDRVNVRVTDDGHGFYLPGEGRAAAPDVCTSGLHRGLQTMRERAESVGGSLRVVSAPGRGTRVIARLPVDAGRQ
jgi:signal transduction histidine kinase